VTERTRSLGLLVAVTCLGAAAAQAAGRTGPKPGPSAAASASASASASAADPYELPAPPAAKADPKTFGRGVVSVEAKGKLVALGVLLANDGRVLTALSPLAAVNEVTVRYADGKEAKAWVVHQDAGWDLALLAPAPPRRKDGLAASERDPLTAGKQLYAFTLAKRPAVVPMSFKGHKTLVGPGDTVLRDVIELGAKAASGTPVLDDAGAVVALVARACAPTAEEGKCVPAAFGAPTQAVRTFLRGVPAGGAGPAEPWLGVEVFPDAVGVARGVRIRVVQGDSPADDAGLKGGPRDTADLIVAVDGVPVTAERQLTEALRTHGLGERVPLLVFNGGKFRQVGAVLRPAPPAPAAPPASSALPAPEERH
jgi:serine protease Do